MMQSQQNSTTNKTVGGITMRNIEKWLEKNGYAFETITLYNVNGSGIDKPCISVKTPYTGPYPGRKQFDALHRIESYINRFYTGLTVQQRGHYSAVFIY
jgi:hypothetical protein